MHLININTVQLKEFSPRQKPKYAVLSHRWTKNEVLFGGMDRQTLDAGSTPAKYGYMLQQTAKDNLKYAWIDTCCIDKQNNVELSEAINSMYGWYQNAQICYVYLEDVELRDWQWMFKKSIWFKRGWTLQELLAPRHVIFYDRSWQKLGDKTSLADEIAAITGIPTDVLRSGDLWTCCVAQKMAWAAKRTTTRPEDQAYCLMGLFGVNMPLLYGEGEKAFIRLQEEIVRYNDDHSIFAWSMGNRKVSGLFAPAPDAFTQSQRVITARYIETHEPFYMTNRGLSITLNITPWSADTYLACLNCANDLETQNGEKRIGIFLRRLDAADQYVRIRFARTGLCFDTEKLLLSQGAHISQNRKFEKRQMFVRQGVDLHPEDGSIRDRSYGFQLPIQSPASEVRLLPAVHFCYDTRIAALQPGGWGGVVRLNIPDYGIGLGLVALGFDFNFNPVCLLEDESSQNKWLESWDIWSRVQNDELSWNTISEGRVVRPEPEEDDGLWAVKGDRNEGLDVIMQTPQGSGPILTLRRKSVQSRLVWAFSIH